MPDAGRELTSSAVAVVDDTARRDELPLADDDVERRAAAGPLPLPATGRGEANARGGLTSRGIQLAEGCQGDPEEWKGRQRREGVEG